MPNGADPTCVVDFAFAERLADAVIERRDADEFDCVVRGATRTLTRADLHVTTALLEITAYSMFWQTQTKTALDQLRVQRAMETLKETYPAIFEQVALDGAVRA